MRRFGFRNWLVLLGVPALLLAAANPAQSQQKGVIKIATQSPLSGAQAAWGQAIKLGAQLAIEQLKGPIEKLGFRIELIPFDDQAEPPVGIANAQHIVGDKDILLVIGHLNSRVAIPSSDVYKQAGLPMISPANTHPILTDRQYSNVNRVIGRDDLQGEAAAEFAKILGVKTAYVIHDKTVYGQGVAGLFQNHAKKVGIEVVGFEGIEGKFNFDPILTPIKAKNPDLIFLGGIYDQAASFFKQAREKGVKSKFLGPDGLNSPELVKIAGRAVVGMYYTTVVGPITVYPTANKFVEDFKKKFRESPAPFSAQAYDATAIGLKAIEAAIREAGGKRPLREAVAARIRGTKQDGVTGTIEFDEKGDLKKATYFVLQVVSDDPAKWSENKLLKRLEIAAQKPYVGRPTIWLPPGAAPPPAAGPPVAGPPPPVAAPPSSPTAPTPTPSSVAAPVPPARIYNAWFQESGPANRHPSLLEIGRIYTLLFYIGKPRPENLLSSQEVSASLQKELSTKDIDVVVQLSCTICQTAQQNLVLRLRARGDTEILAFSVQPIYAGWGTLDLSIIYNNAIYDAFQIPVRVGSTREIAKWQMEKEQPPSMRAAPRPNELENIEPRDYFVSVYEEHGVLNVWVSGGGASRRYETTMPPDDLVAARQKLWKALHLIMNGQGPVAYTQEERGLLGFRKETRDAIMLSLAEIGYSVYRKLFESDPALASRMNEIKSQSKSGPIRLAISTRGGINFPWALVNDEPVSVRTKTFSVDGFWGLRYILEHVFEGREGKRLGSSKIDNRSGMKVLMAVYDEERAKPQDRTRYMILRDTQIGWFTGLRPQVFTDVARDEDSFLAQLRNEGRTYNVIYFYTHASSGSFETELRDEAGHSYRVFIPNQPEASISLTPPPPPAPHSIRPLELSAEKFDLASYPFVFMNTCDSGTVVALSNDTFAATFWEMGARVILVTEAQMWQNFAKDFAGRLLGSFFARNDLGSSLLQVRRSYLTDLNNPFGLLYTLYGDSMTKLSDPLPFTP